MVWRKAEDAGERMGNWRREETTWKFPAQYKTMESSGSEIGPIFGIVRNDPRPAQSWLQLVGADVTIPPTALG